MEDLNNMPELVILSGMSGAGRTEAMHVFEDLGYYCVDNLPPSLIRDLIMETEIPSAGGTSRVAIVCDARAHEFYANMSTALTELSDMGVDYSIVFLDADDEKLIAYLRAFVRSLNGALKVPSALSPAVDAASQ